MEDKFINVPADVNQPDILKRFLTELVDKLNNNALVSGPILYPAGYAGPANLTTLNSIGDYTNSILEATARLDRLSGDSKNYITSDLKAIVLSNSKDVAVIVEQFGTFYDTSTAAAWYGLTVKTGELISGFTVGGVDSDTTTPGTAGSFFAISADKFSVGRAITDITNPAELAYVQANNLPYGTMYNASTGKITPAFLIEWNGTSYDIFFNGKVQFSNIADANTYIPTMQSVIDAKAVADNVTIIVNDITNDSKFTPNEKSTWKPAWDNAVAEYTILQTKASLFDLLGSSAWITYNNNAQALYTYMTPLFANMGATDTIVSTQFQSLFSNYFNSRTALMGAFPEVVKVIADSKILASEAAAAINNNITTINGSKITTGSINAGRITAGHIGSIAAVSVTPQLNAIGSTAWYYTGTAITIPNITTVNLNSYVSASGVANTSRVTVTDTDLMLGLSSSPTVYTQIDGAAGIVTSLVGNYTLTVSSGASVAVQVGGLTVYLWSRTTVANASAIYGNFNISYIGMII